MTATATLLGTGSYLPEIELTNEELRARLCRVDPELGEAVDKLEHATKIRTRWLAPDDWSTSDLAVQAALSAMDDAGVTVGDIDMVIVGTDSPDYITPATSVVVQHKLGAHRAGTFDVGCACASFPTAVSIANGLIATNPWMKHVLVIGAYLMHRLADPDDPMSFLYGDGAGAAVLGRADEPGLLSSAFRAIGGYHRHWGIYSGGTAEPASAESVAAGRTHVRLVERFPPEVNHNGWPALVRDLAERGAFEVADIDMAIFTQVRQPSITTVMETLALPIERTHWVMDRWGYTGSACIPMALHDARRAGKIGSGDLITLVGSGVGANLAGVALRAA